MLDFSKVYRDELPAVQAIVLPHVLSILINCRCLTCLMTTMSSSSYWHAALGELPENIVMKFDAKTWKKYCP